MYRAELLAIEKWNLAFSKFFYTLEWGGDMQVLLYLLLGLVAGVFGGMFGLGGGLIIIPVLVLLGGFTQHQAQGTNLFIMLPPIGLLAAMQYYRAGYVKLNIVGFICLGFLIGGLAGGYIVQGLPAAVLRKTFGALLLTVSVKMILGK